MKPFRFGIIGEYQSGKSLLVNCLLQRPIATVGVGNATTHTIVNYIYATKEHVVYKMVNGEYKTISIEGLNKLDTATDICEIDVYLSNELLKDFIVTDMPGFGANLEDNMLARKILHSIDFAILIASNDKVIGGDTESFHELKVLQTYNIPYYFFLNCTNTDRWRCDDETNINIAKKDLSLLDFYKPSSYPLNDDRINIINLMWYWYSICDEEDCLIKRNKNINAFNEYEISRIDKNEVGVSSNFEIINILFSMENKMYLELKRELKEEISRLKREVCPIGTIQAFAYNSIPEGWLLCDGSSMNISEYSDLYEIIGTTFGGNGVDSFNLPDMRGVFVRGWDAGAGRDPERLFGSLQEDSIQNHIHKVLPSTIYTESGGTHYHTYKVTKKYAVTSVGGLGNTEASDEFLKQGHTYGNSGNDYWHTSDENSSHLHTINLNSIKLSEPQDVNSLKVKYDNETRPRNIALQYCIKVS